MSLEQMGIAACVLMNFIVLGMFVPVYGKLFFSSHSVEYRPLEEYVKLREGLGLEDSSPIDELNEQAKQQSKSIFDGLDEDYEELRSYPDAVAAQLKMASESTHKPFRKPIKPAADLDG